MTQEKPQYSYYTRFSILSSSSLCQVSSSAALESVDSALEGYASVGGLDAQIAQIRDLIEVPLTQPELFRHFGNFYLPLVLPVN